MRLSKLGPEDCEKVIDVSSPNVEKPAKGSGDSVKGKREEEEEEDRARVKMAIV